MNEYKISSREVHGENEVTVSISGEVVAKFYGENARADFMCWADGKRQWATRLDESFSVYDENRQHYTHGTVGQMFEAAHDAN